MGVRNYSSSLSVPTDWSQCFMLKHLSIYLNRLLDEYCRLDYETLEVLHWLLGPEIVQDDLIPLAGMLNGEERRRRFEQEIVQEIRSPRDFAHLMDQALRKTRRNEQLAAIDLFRGLLEKRIGQLRYSGISDIERNIDSLQQMFGLSELETDICLFFLILSVYDEAQSLFEYHLKCDRYAGRSHLATILSTKSTEISKAITGKLSRIGILEPSRGTVSLEPDFLRFLQNSTEADINTEFFKKIDPHSLPLDAHSIESNVTEHALRLLSPDSRKGCSIILYGNPGVGKTTFAYGLGQELGLEIYLCKHEGKDKQWQRQAAIMASVNMASHNKDSLLIVDDCDSILGTRHLWGLFGSYNDKKWLHEVLESDAKIIFIVNDVRFLEESVIRRFDYSIHFKPFSRSQRILLWKNLLESQNVGLALTDAQISDLAAVYDTSPGIIDMAVKTAAQSAPTLEEGFYKAITLALDAHECLCHGGHKPSRRNGVDKNFCLDGLNVVGTDLNAFLQDLQTFDKYLRKSGENDPIGCSILFHGPSGTGKTHMACHIGLMLDRQVVSKRGSDLLSPYVGETEARIRAAYDEAASKEAVLVINEAESLIFNRDKGQRSWELSVTNEFLNCMEEFKGGVQIFTTNRLSDLDSAALRRFDYKLEFGYLQPEGILAFYDNFFLSLAGSPLDRGLKDELIAISRLTPGDFKVVRFKYRFKAPPEISHKDLIAALKKETKVKEIHAGRTVIGF